MFPLKCNRKVSRYFATKFFKFAEGSNKITTKFGVEVGTLDDLVSM